jgi:hypothetical protein
MRASRLLLAGAAVAAAGVATSAFTASNTVPASVAGFGQGAVSGAVITNIHYVSNPGNGTVLDAVELTSTTNLTGKTVTVTLKTTGGTVVVGTPYSCVTLSPWSAGEIVLTCSTTGSTRLFSDFDAVGVTVIQ